MIKRDFFVPNINAYRKVRIIKDNRGVWVLSHNKTQKAVRGNIVDDVFVPDEKYTDFIENYAKDEKVCKRKMNNEVVVKQMKKEKLKIKGTSERYYCFVSEVDNTAYLTFMFLDEEVRIDGYKTSKRSQTFIPNEDQFIQFDKFLNRKRVIGIKKPENSKEMKYYENFVNPLFIIKDVGPRKVLRITNVTGLYSYKGQRELISLSSDEIVGRVEEPKDEIPVSNEYVENKVRSFWDKIKEKVFTRTSS